MKRFLLLAITAILFAATANTAQAQETDYQGEILFGGGLGVGKLAQHRLQITSIQGVNIDECVSLGIGFGVDWFSNDFKNGTYMIPLFYNTKFYAPTDGNFDPFISASIGYGFNPESTGSQSIGGLMMDAGIGFKAGTFMFSIGYHLQQIGKLKENNNFGALQLKIGVVL